MMACSLKHPPKGAQAAQHLGGRPTPALRGELSVARGGWPHGGSGAALVEGCSATSQCCTCPRRQVAGRLQAQRRQRGWPVGNDPASRQPSFAVTTTPHSAATTLTHAVTPSLPLPNHLTRGRPPCPATPYAPPGPHCPVFAACAPAPRRPHPILATALPVLHHPRCSSPATSATLPNHRAAPRRPVHAATLLAPRSYPS